MQYAATDSYWLPLTATKCSTENEFSKNAKKSKKDFNSLLTLWIQLTVYCLMNRWWADDELMMNRWWTDDELMMSRWWTDDERMMSWWWADDEQVMNRWWVDVLNCWAELQIYLTAIGYTKCVNNLDHLGTLRATCLTGWIGLDWIYHRPLLRLEHCL